MKKEKYSKKKEEFSERTVFCEQFNDTMNVVDNCQYCQHKNDFDLERLQFQCDNAEVIN